MDRNNIDKIAQTAEDRLLLAKLWDKINNGIRRNIVASTSFLSPREQELARYLFGQQPGLFFFGGYEEAERRMLIFLPDYLDSSYLQQDASPVVCLRATWHQSNDLSHRDLLGALMGCGIARETVGDLCVGTDSCDFFVTDEIAPHILQNFSFAGRTKLSLCQITPDELSIPEPETKEIHDTVASLRLDSILSSGFRISRSLAAQHIAAGKAAVDGLPCEKPDKIISEGSKLSVRGLGKIKLRTVNGQTKKGRISITIDRYV